jgi:hypothetical protein
MFFIYFLILFLMFTLSTQKQTQKASSSLHKPAKLPDFDISILPTNSASGGVTPYDLASFRKVAEKHNLKKDANHFDL